MPPFQKVSGTLYHVAPVFDELWVESKTGCEKDGYGSQVGRQREGVSENIGPWTDGRAGRKWIIGWELRPVTYITNAGFSTWELRPTTISALLNEERLRKPTAVIKKYLPVISEIPHLVGLNRGTQSVHGTDAHCNLIVNVRCSQFRRTRLQESHGCLQSLQDRIRTGSGKDVVAYGCVPR
jgi:hypothetical protein